MVEGYPVRSWVRVVTVEIFTIHVINQFSHEFVTCIDIKEFLRTEKELAFVEASQGTFP
jgi:hypothetical protein